jgi:hypothetical protein
MSRKEIGFSTRLERQARPGGEKLQVHASHVRQAANARSKNEGDVTMQAEARSVQTGVVEARPLAELLDCPPATGNLLTGSAQCLNVESGQAVFCQDEACKGLYLVISGEFVRRTERLKSRLTLGPVRVGDLVELAAVLGENHHTYTLSALNPGIVLLLPMATLREAFERYPPLRMRLLEELAREVSRAYISCCMSRRTPARRRSKEAARK